MLLNDLFIVNDRKSGQGTLNLTVRVRFPHRIFDGHFPGRPVLPGACLLQLVAELAPSAAGREVRLVRSGPIKFIRMIDPVADGVIAMTMTVRAGGEADAGAGGEAVGEWLIEAEAVNAGATCFRFTGVFRAE